MCPHETLFAKEIALTCSGNMLLKITQGWNIGIHEIFLVYMYFVMIFMHTLFGLSGLICNDLIWLNLLLKWKYGLSWQMVLHNSS